MLDSRYDVGHHGHLNLNPLIRPRWCLQTTSKFSSPATFQVQRRSSSPADSGDARLHSRAPES
eukprot:1372280-Rhodomonas_salina.2